MYRLHTMVLFSRLAYNTQIMAAVTYIHCLRMVEGCDCLLDQATGVHRRYRQ